MNTHTTFNAGLALLKLQQSIARLEAAKAK